ncbi:hypothetical protein AGABI2DRAFT_118243 [Agaricus bisporus var. bisporus H97]|uniref:hypothetical protein n=1 Tax=Agaricus bisporus var. bisporus (strain H97 / ATCC MYA-4626 / FGSC 10389) TaxID=936046 RepID=UPI00029F69A9|nr:hypothetical protein AGABI2DRAFT_118243 [Agaricus bisporus var. bisporus H97]EKV47694.1 hypothetical protein AGABI2DRAFT_118243 [Agaricus bisporus var. bisporus H97]
MSRQVSRMFENNNEKKQNRARRIVLAKGAFDFLFALSIMFLPKLAYDGIVPALVAKYTGLQFVFRDRDPGGVYFLASLIMGCAFAALSAGMSAQEDAHKTVATLNGMFAYFGLLGCIFSPKSFGSSVLLLASLQDVAWFFMIVLGGGYSVADTLGLKNALGKLKEKKREINAERERRKTKKQQEQGQHGEKHSSEGGT